MGLVRHPSSLVGVHSSILMFIARSASSTPSSTVALGSGLSYDPDSSSPILIKPNINFGYTDILKRLLDELPHGGKSPRPCRPCRYSQVRSRSVAEPRILPQSQAGDH
ncbi:hypothetical protein F5B18DRAFT_616679 [Nemania serpens]|nr:hypothetical protein F5B18DRAFT_616679 [Nemania serpens]